MPLPLFFSLVLLFGYCHVQRAFLVAGGGPATGRLKTDKEEKPVGALAVGGVVLSFCQASGRCRVTLRPMPLHLVPDRQGLFMLLAGSVSAVIRWPGPASILHGGRCDAVRLVPPRCGTGLLPWLPLVLFFSLSLPSVLPGSVCSPGVGGYRCCRLSLWPSCPRYSLAHAAPAPLVGNC